MNPKEKNEFASLDHSLAQPTSSVRRRGLMRLTLGLAGVLVVYGVTRWLLPYFGLQFTPRGLMIAAIPGAFGLLGFMEAVTGIPYGEMASRWDSLKGWQRGVLGSCIVLFAGFLIIMIFAYIVIPMSQ